MGQPPKDIQLRARIDEAVAKGTYFNCASIAPNRSEFIIDFGRIVPNSSEVKILARVLTTPLVVKQLHRALGQNIEQYEKKFGDIAGDEDGLKRVGF